MTEIERQIRGAITDGTFVSAVLSEPKHGAVSTIRVKPVTIGGSRRVQFEFLAGPKATHENVPIEKAAGRISDLMAGFKQAAVFLTTEDLHVILKGPKPRVRHSPPTHAPADPSHDRTRDHLIPEGTPCAFLERLGIMDRRGKVHPTKFGKFRQINRFLEFVDDIDGILLGRPLRVIDFGCGKSYLTFAMHHYFTSRGREVDMVGLDLRQDVVADCSAIARDLGCKGLAFATGDIASRKETAPVDLVVMLHACDTATDDGLAKAVAWKSKAILAAPCCQHELRAKIAAQPIDDMLKHGILRERVAALATDSMRAALLESAGYATQVVEFIETEHTPKNLLIKAVRQGSVTGPATYNELKSFWGAGPKLESLLKG